VVDDEQVVRQVLSRMLERLGYECQIEARASLAIEYYRAHPKQVDLVLIDQAMPEMSGFECFRKLCDLDPEVRAVMATGFGPEALPRIEEPGIRGYLQKPFQLAELDRVLSAALGPTAGPS
jgi:CheY-like chemotaxis protein